ncbi:putative spermidine/putrescine transport system permease protein [Clostridium tetanomorphum]|uniref:ABC transporter permease n=1 Tax=Clostridium tetanomorphum TaxID=1553 RepID=A0A923EAU4_CLOTT|nr:ABC transporter permease [Clostridium tetanomorphum]KAJ51962.1 binding-protein-dependent transport system inner membrane protein [Clostridium tetanomorphum DSM 665]MBC2396963.1 ABC transporter permease [Clostridium tetanomorphum]MBP1862882.1 putative spermidine/putrescine transport system permease protein [Clostridium tetanomorphum]NRS87019.1 putative spermidine/putrescine transport system permease protein [Clostridium tetanomorphum]NRZ99195.1 putative spermidine/putrescine transport system
MKKKWSYILLIPGLSIILFFLIFPIINSIMPTFFTKGSLSLEQYNNFFRDKYFMQIFNRTLRISLLSALICMILGVPVAYFISRSSKKLRGLLIACTVFPMLTNSVVRAFAWMNILGKNGMINKVLMSFNIIDQPYKLLYTEFAILVGTVYLFLPLMIVSLVGVMENIDNDLLEAAESLGANRLKAFFKVVFPLSIPGLIVGTVLVFTGALTAYTTPQLLGGNSNMVLATLIYQKTMSLGDWNGAAVVSTVMILTTLLVIGTINKLASRLNERGV